MRSILPIPATRILTPIWESSDASGTLAEREWFSDRYTVLDPYGFVFYTWGLRRQLPMGELKNYTAFKDRMIERPAVRRVVDGEQIKL